MPKGTPTGTPTMFWEGYSNDRTLISGNEKGEQMNSLPKEQLIVALDVDDLKQAERLVEQLVGYISTFKIGLQLFSNSGPDAIKMVKDRGGRVFLDLKFHDIPNTVAKASEELVKLGVSIFNLHTLGGVKMMRKSASAARKKAKEVGLPPPLILGVTILTSIDERTLKEELKIKRDIKNYVSYLSSLAKKAGLDGVVASAGEIKKIRKTLGEDFIILTPGIRPAGSRVDDQKRVATPTEAIKAGANLIVVGRPIILASNPLRVVKNILKELGNAQ